MNSKNNPEAIILGGSENALSLTRSLGRRGVDINLCVPHERNAHYSKYVKRKFPYDAKDRVQEYWKKFLLSEESSSIHGSIIFTCNDDAVEFVANNREALQKLYILDDSKPDLHLQMLDKKKTLELARSLSIPTPNFMEINDTTEAKDILNQFEFPVMIKPINSHLFQKKVTGRKYFKANNPDELNGYIEQIKSLELEAMITELIPGPDTLLGSYYTYIDSTGKSHFHYTKKVIRRWPKNEGKACYHISEWNDEIAELGATFFQGIKYRGMGNIEFKKDLRDGKYKVIECNPRFTAAQELLVRSGLDAASVIYNHLAGLPPYTYKLSKKNRYFWYPIRDYKAFKELKSKNEISFVKWIKSVMHLNILPFFQWTDPLPTLKPFLSSIKNKIGF